ncbi:hypothetical protein M1432_02760 [Patescibacteria group bacterium]|nr:hypothetical protein [Patescibacteria group bacterium]
MKNIFKKIVPLIDKLSSKPAIDGLEISDASLTYAYFYKDEIKTTAVKLAPGIVKGGKLEDKAAFIEALRALHGAVLPDSSEKLLKVDCVLPSSAVYTQSFDVPNVGNDKLEETVDLNLQMISPIAVGEANMSAEVIGETPDRVELLGAFAERSAINDFKEALVAARFAPAAFELSALALTRLVVRSVKVGPRPVLTLHLKSDGIDLAILRDNALHFSYFRSWQSIQGEARSISRSVFDSVVVEEVRKVINFSVSRWGEGPAGVLLVAPNFEKEIVGLLAANFNLKAAAFVPAQISLDSAFYVAFGAALRSREASVNEPFRAINVGGEDSVNMMSQDQIINFIGLWRNIIAGVLAILLVAFIFSASFLVKMANSIGTQSTDFNPSLDQKSLADLSAKAGVFNAMVRGVEAARAGAVPWYPIIEHLIGLAKSNQVVLTDISISNMNSPVQVAATAPDYATVLEFKNALSGDPNFANVNLPLTQVTTQGDGSVSFSVSFTFTSQALSL